MIDKKTVANLQGYLAVLLWSFSALFISWTSDIPPLLTASLTSVVGFLFFTFSWLLSPRKFINALNQNWQIWGLFFLSIVVYRGLYLAGLKLSPIIESNLLNYLWPLLIVLLAAFHDRVKPSLPVIVGAVCCFLGVICIGIGKKGAAFSFEIGHLLAIAGAFTWAIYSILTRKFPGAPTDTMGLLHFAAIWIFWGLHSLCEPSVNLNALPPLTWIGVCGWGLAISYGYSLWDRAMTHGNRDVVAVAAYYTPLLSTFWLILLDKQSLTMWVWIAAALILGGSLLARFENKIKKVWLVRNMS